MNKDKIIEYQLMEQQIQQLDNNLQNIDQNIKDIDTILQTLDNFSKLKKGDNILVPVANGIFAEAKLEGSGRLKVNVGSNIVVEKDVESTKKMMSQQIEELEKYKEETAGYYEQMYIKMQALQTEMIKEQEQEKKKK
ncbi:MAG: prefoldin subunit alpha [archaeon]